MTGPQHYEAAEALLEDLRQHREVGRWSMSDVLAQAQVHADPCSGCQPRAECEPGEGRSGSVEPDSCVAT